MKSKILYNRESGRSRGFGFVSFRSEEGLTKALEKNGANMNGRVLRVIKKEDREERDERRVRDRRIHKDVKRERSRDRAPAASAPARSYDNTNKLIVLRI